MQKLKTKVVNKNLNPEWNDDLTLSISDPHAPIQLVSKFSSNSVCVSEKKYRGLIEEMKIAVTICIMMLLNYWYISLLSLET